MSVVFKPHVRSNFHACLDKTICLTKSICQCGALINDVFTQFMKKKKIHKNYIFLERQDQDANLKKNCLALLVQK